VGGSGCFLFFFQAEDGIRDDLVTGVQTCALPISTTSSTRYVGPFAVTQTTTLKAMAAAPGMADSSVSSATYTIQVLPPTLAPGRSEERRVGKECRTRCEAEND